LSVTTGTLYKAENYLVSDVFHVSEKMALIWFPSIN